MTAPGNPNANNIQQLPLYDPSNHEVVAWEADTTTTATDSSITPSVTYAKALVTVGNANPNGQTTMVNSTPVVIASDQTPVQIKGGFTEVAGQGTSVVNGINTDLIPAMDVSIYKSFSIQATGTWSATFTVQGSNDGVNFVGTTVNVAGAQSTVATSFAANGIYFANIQYRWLRIRATSFASNASLVGTLELYTQPFAMHQVGTVSQPSNTPNTTPWLFTQANNNASVPTGAANTVIKNAAGQLSTIVVTTAGTGAGNVQIFDNASTNSGTVLFAFPATVSVAQAYQIYGWAKLGMTAQNVANGPVFTVFYS